MYTLAYSPAFSVNLHGLINRDLTYVAACLLSRSTFFILFSSHLQKADKWAKMISQEDNTVMLMEFLDKAESRILVIYLNQQGQLTPINQFPSTSKNKV